MQNIEIKVRVSSLAGIRHLAIQLGAEHKWTLSQVDTYFNVRHGRLKLRETSTCGSATLISYARPDESASRFSHYRLLPVSEPESLREMLSESLGILVTVRKQRELYTYGEARIHLDLVEQLGTFVELETVIADQPLDDAWAEHRTVFGALKLDSYETVPFGYSDLMMR
jgi:predicted adenylyl cyclase CyaB